MWRPLLGASLEFDEADALTIGGLRPGTAYEVQVRPPGGAWGPTPPKVVETLDAAPAETVPPPLPGSEPPAFTADTTATRCHLALADGAAGAAQSDCEHFVQYWEAGRWASTFVPATRLAFKGKPRCVIQGLVPGRKYHVQVFAKPADGPPSAWGPSPPLLIETEPLRTAEAVADHAATFEGALPFAVGDVIDGVERLPGHGGYLYGTLHGRGTAGVFAETAVELHDGGDAGEDPDEATEAAAGGGPGSRPSTPESADEPTPNQVVGTPSRVI